MCVCCVCVRVCCDSPLSETGFPVTCERSSSARLDFFLSCFSFFLFTSAPSSSFHPCRSLFLLISCRLCFFLFSPFFLFYDDLLLEDLLLSLTFCFVFAASSVRLLFLPSSPRIRRKTRACVCVYMEEEGRGRGGGSWRPFFLFDHSHPVLLRCLFGLVF